MLVRFGFGIFSAGASESHEFGPNTFSTAEIWVGNFPSSVFAAFWTGQGEKSAFFVPVLEQFGSPGTTVAEFAAVLSRWV